MIRTLTATPALIALFALPAAAEIDCANAEDQTSLNACAATAAAQAAETLDGLYGALGTTLDAGGLARLEATQAAWMTYRDTFCAMQAAEYEGGSIYPMVLAYCREDLTNAQIPLLEQSLDCPEGDISCVQD